ncbi:MAG TPA: S1C family serine protease [Chloroflexota bacterium]|nr:S1C family serine protease [Chloroflexota bacterium]
MTQVAPTEAPSSPAAGVLAAFSDELAGTVERVGRSVVRVDAGRRYPGSGVVWQVEGGAVTILTVDHVIESEEHIEIGFADGTTAKATIAARDENSDLALLRVESSPSDLTALPRHAIPRVGQLALVVARPGSALSTSIGVVGAISPAGRGSQDSLIWTDASFYPGFGGAPLVDAAGQMIGLATSTARTGAGVAIPVSTIERVVQSLQRHGRIRRGFLGIGSQQVELPEALRSKLGVQQSTGLLVMGVEAGGPADKAGLMIGDVLVTLAGQPTEDHPALLGLLSADRVGQATPARVIRGGELRDVTVTVGERRSE